MPIFITLKHGEPLMARGHKTLGLVLRLFFLRWARVQMMQNDDYEWLPASNVAKIHPIGDDDFMKRNAELEARRAAEAKRNPRPGDKPHLVVPGRP
jgi:hypothetical protein